MRLRGIINVAEQVVDSRFSSIELPNKADLKLFMGG